jgi:DNA-binding NarL/FixJ family response regulator
MYLYNYDKIALVDDHQIIIDGLKSLLNQSSSIQLVATANSGMEILLN